MHRKGSSNNRLPFFFGSILKVFAFNCLFFRKHIKNKIYILQALTSTFERKTGEKCVDLAE